MNSTKEKAITKECGQWGETEREDQALLPVIKSEVFERYFIVLFALFLHLWDVTSLLADTITRSATDYTKNFSPRSPRSLEVSMKSIKFSLPHTIHGCPVLPTFLGCQTCVIANRSLLFFPFCLLLRKTLTLCVKKPWNFQARKAELKEY